MKKYLPFNSSTPHSYGAHGEVLWKPQEVIDMNQPGKELKETKLPRRIKSKRKKLSFDEFANELFWKDKDDSDESRKDEETRSSEEEGDK